MKKHIAVVALLLFSFALGLPAQWVQTPFGQAWVGSGPAPTVQTSPAPQKAVPFVPSFEKGVFISVTIGGQVHTYPVNDAYFATKETAEALCKKLLCVAVTSEPLFISGPYQCSAKQRFLIWADGVEHNAGVLADYYRRNPEKDFPGLADWFVNGILKAKRAAMLSVDSKSTLV